MIPRLVNTYPYTGTGITLTDTISCKVTEERNGAFELEMVVATTTPYFEEIKEGRYILAKPNHTQGAQAFEIYEISRPINQRVTIRAHHISYRLSFIPVEPFSCTGITDTLNGLVSNSMETNPFAFNTTITNEQSTYNQTAPASIRSRLGGTEGSVLDVFGGEYVWDNLTVSLLLHRGQDNGVQLRVAKNISALEQTTNLENVVTGALPYWSNEDGTVNLYGDIQYNSHVNDYDYKRTVLLDLSEQFETAPSSTQLNTAAQQYVNQTNLGIVNTNIKLSFVDLADTNEYEGSPLERVNLCDTVTVIYNPLSITYQAKAIRLTYDVLAERTLEVEVGDAKSTIAKTISDLVGDISSVVTVGKKLVSVTQKIDRELGEVRTTVASVQQTVDGSINHITYLYAYGDSATQKPDDTAFTYGTMPPLVSGKYIWRMSLAYTNENPTSNPTKTYEMIQGAQGAQGEPGQGEPGTDGYNSATIYLYQRAASTPSKPAATNYTFSTHSLSSVPSGWSITVPSGTNPLYVSTVSVSSQSDTVSIASSAWSTPQIMASNGTNGTNGTNGISYYTHIRYSANSDGSSMTSSPQANTKYIGVYTGTSSTAPTTASSYTWSKYVGDNITITSIQYAASSSGVFPAPTSGWQSSPPTVAAGNYLWTKVNYSSGDPSYSVSYQGRNGTNGTNGTDGEDGVSVTGIDNLYYLKNARLDIVPNGNTTQGANPSPSSPQAIHTVTGDNEIRVVGKNLIPITATTQTLNGVTFTVNGDGTVRANGTATASFSFNFFYRGSGIENGIPLTAGTTYVLSTADMQYFPINIQIMRNGQPIAVSSNSPFTAQEGDYVSLVWVWRRSGTVFNNALFSPQFEVGSTPTAFEPYKAQVYPINLGSIELNALGPYKDYFHKTDGKWYLYKAFDKADLGSLTWARRTTNIFSSSLPTSANVSGDVGSFMSNYFIVEYAVGYAATNPNKVAMYKASSTTSTTTIYLNLSSVDTVADLTTWFSTNATELVYPLATPTEIEITDTVLVAQLDNLALAISYDGGTNLLQTNSDNPFILTYNTNALTRPSKPVAEVTTSSNLPEVWSLQPATFINGYRYYNTLQVHYDNNTLTWTDVVEDSSMTYVSQQVSTMNTDIVQNAEAIALKADASTVDTSISSLNNRVGKVESDSAELQVTASGISETVSSIQSNLNDNYLTTEETKAEIKKSADSISETFSQTVTDEINGVTNTVSTMIRRSGTGIDIGVEGTDNSFVSHFDNDSLDFNNTSTDTTVAWVDASDGLGGKELSVGDYKQQSNRWRIFTRQNGSHLTFTRHS